MVRTEDSQSSDIGFNSHIRHCGCRTMASTSDCGSDDASSILAGHINLLIELLCHVSGLVRKLS